MTTHSCFIGITDEGRIVLTLLGEDQNHQLELPPRDFEQLGNALVGLAHEERRREQSASPTGGDRR